MASAFKRERASGFVWYVKFKDHHGRPVQKVTSCRTERAAKAMGFKLEEQAEKKRLDIQQNGAQFEGSFAELVEWAWQVHFKDLRGKDSAFYVLRKHGKQSELGPMAATDITTQVVERYLYAVSQTPTQRGSLPSPAGLNRIRATLSGVFSVAIRHGQLRGENPLTRVTKRKLKKGNSGDFLRSHEVGPVLQALNERWRGVFATCILAGLRRGEAFALQHRDVDLERGELTVRRSHEHEMTKGGEEDVVPIHDALRPILEAALRGPGPWVFPNHLGQRHKATTKLSPILRRAMATAGIVERYDHLCRRCKDRAPEQWPDAEIRRCGACEMKLWPRAVVRPIRWHDTRHTLATLALAAGASLASTQKLMRHSSPQLTANFYGHLQQSHLKTALDLVSVPGVAAPWQAVPIQRAEVEPTVAQCELRKTGGASEGANRVRDHQPGVTDPNRYTANSAKAVGFSRVEPTGLEPVTTALRMRTEPHGTIGQSSQTGGSIRQGSPQPGDKPFHGGTVRHSSGADKVRVADSPHLFDRRFTTRPGASNQLLTVRAVAAQLSVSTAWVYQRVDRGELPCSRLGNAIRIAQADIDQLLRGGRG